MRGIDFLSGCGVVVALLIGTCGVGEAVPPPSKQPDTQTEAAPEADQPTPAASAAPVGIVPEGDSSPEARDQAAQERQEQRDSRDVEAQETMAFAALLMVWIAGVQILVGIITIGFLWRTLHHTRRTADAGIAAAEAAQASVAGAQDTARKQLRAYVSASETSIDFTNGAYVAVVTLKNTGQTPAYRITGWIRCAGPICADFGPGDEGQLPLPWTDIGPGEEHPLTKALDIPYPLPANAASRDEISAHVWGRVQYEDAFGERRYTNFRYMIAGDAAEPPKPPLGFYVCDEGNNSN